MRRVYLAGPPYADEYRRRAAALARELGWEPVDPMRRDYRGRTEGSEAEIVEGDLADIDSCDAVLAAFTSADEGTAMEAWYAHSRGKPVVAYTGGALRIRGPCTWRRGLRRSRAGRARTGRLTAMDVEIHGLRIAYGDRDVRSSLAVAEDLHAAIPASTLAVRFGVGRVSSVEAAERFSAEVRSFSRSAGRRDVDGAI